MLVDFLIPAPAHEEELVAEATVPTRDGLLALRTAPPLLWPKQPLLLVFTQLWHIHLHGQVAEWQTHRLEVPAGNTVRVRLPP